MINRIIQEEYLNEITVLEDNPKCELKIEVNQEKEKIK